MRDFALEYWALAQLVDRTLCYDGKCCTYPDCRYKDRRCEVKS